MENQNLFLSFIIFLASALICVPLTKKLGLGSVLGYLIAGILVGPFGLKFITNVEEIMHFSEFGVVLLLFIIGLELEPKKLWNLRTPIFGMGGVQVIANATVFSLLAIFLGLTWQAALVIGMGLALSSTAIALQVLNEGKFIKTTAGNANFSILLFQDIAVIPMLAVLPLLVPNTTAQNSIGHGKIALSIGIILLTVVAGRHLVRPLLRFIASLHLREIFTATALLLVMSMAFLMHKLEISMALGSFIAGVLLADSEYKHALETDIEPFKGLLLGLFFISVGMSVNLETIAQKPLLLISVVTAVFTIKTVVHFAIGKLFKLPKTQIAFFSLVISQVGEFAFVLFGAALTFNIFDRELNELLLAAVALSMLLTPIVVKIYDYITAIKKENSKPKHDIIEDDNTDVIIAGFGRYGQIIGRLLHANKIKATVLDFEPDQIELLRRFGFKVYYGDATRLDLLESAGIQKAKILVVAIDDVESNLKLVQMAKHQFPHLKIFARARNVQHVFDLMDVQIDGIERETFESSLKMGSQVLQALGWPPYSSVQAAHLFRTHNIKMIGDLHQDRNSKQEDFVAKAKQAREDLEKMFEEEHQIKVEKDGSWHN